MLEANVTKSEGGFSDSKFLDFAKWGRVVLFFESCWGKPGDTSYLTKFLWKIFRPIVVETRGNYEALRPLRTL